MPAKTGDELCGEALDLFDESPVATRVVDACFAHMRHLDRFKSGGVSGDDATEYLDSTGYKGDNRIVGAVFRRAGWCKIGEQKSRLPKRHSRVIPLWTWRDSNQKGNE